MSGSACSEACGWCGRCSYGEDRDGAAALEFMETCEHPTEWRTEAGHCRLCGAQEPTITRQARQRLIHPPVPRKGAA